MKYPDGQDICVGDEIQLWKGCKGIVVASINTGDYLDGYSKADWEYLGAGILIESDAAGLLHYNEPESTFRLLRRGPHMTP